MTKTPKNTTIAERKAAMQARLADLGIRLQAIEAELDSHSEKDWEELAVQREGDEVLEATGLSGQQEIRMIQAALSRIDTGDYGHCARCGGDISEARLDVLPFTPFCRDCAGSVDASTHQKRRLRRPFIRSETAMTAQHQTTQTPSFAATTGAMTGQRQILSGLLAEMRALRALLPGVAEHFDRDEEVEARFDNTPA